MFFLFVKLQHSGSQGTYDIFLTNSSYFCYAMEESRIDFLLLERSSCQNKWLSEQEAEIQPVVTITQDKPALSIKIKGRPGENEDLTNFFCTQLFFQPLQGRRMCFSFQAWSSRVYLSLDKLKSVSLSEETDEVTEEAAFQNKSADSVILVHDENDEFLLGEQSNAILVTGPQITALI